MRYVPLVPVSADPRPWSACGAVEVAWDGPAHAGWTAWLRGGGAVHALHFPRLAWEPGLVARAAEALGARLSPDFLVFPAEVPQGRLATAAFLGALTALLEATHSRGVKVALRPAPGAAPGLAALLREVRGEAVGFCWNGEGGEDLEAVSDRLFCAVGRDGADLGPLLALGYRWNLALEVPDPGAFRTLEARFREAFPPVLFPAQLPTHALGRPVLPDEGIVFGQGLGGGRPA